MGRQPNVGVWSVEECNPKFNWNILLLRIKQLTYEGNTITFTETPSKRRIKGACETLIKQSGDNHHIYIENLRDVGNGVFRMECGS